MANWVTDDQLFDAADRCAKKLIEMAADGIGNPNKTPPGSLPRTVVDSLRLDVEDFMFYDPVKLDEEYARLLDMAKAIGSDPYAAADLEETKNHLVNWTGDAATAVKRQIDLMREYCDLQQLNILQALQGLLAAGQLAVRARADCLELLEATIAAAEREIGEQSKRDAIAVVSMVEDVLESALSMDVKSLVNDAITIFVKLGSKVTQYGIEGDDSDVVIGNYIQARDSMRRFYDQAFRGLRETISRRIDEVTLVHFPRQSRRSGGSISRRRRPRIPRSAGGSTLIRGRYDYQSPTAFWMGDRIGHLVGGHRRVFVRRGGATATSDSPSIGCKRVHRSGLRPATRRSGGLAWLSNSRQSERGDVIHGGRLRVLLLVSAGVTHAERRVLSFC